MKTTLLALIFLGSYFHDIQVAYYKIHHEDESLRIQMVFEQNDIRNTLDHSDAGYSEIDLQEYIHSNFVLTINNQPQEIIFESIENKNKHIYLTGRIIDEIEQIRTIDIGNTCLINIDDHSNIVEVHSNNTQRDFLMNEDRTSIQITY